MGTETSVEKMTRAVAIPQADGRMNRTLFFREATAKKTAERTIRGRPIQRLVPEQEPPQESSRVPTERGLR